MTQDTPDQDKILDEILFKLVQDVDDMVSLVKDRGAIIATHGDPFVKAKAKLKALFQAHQQQLLTELLKSSHEFGAELTPNGQRVVQAVPVSVIERKIGELNG